MLHDALIELAGQIEADAEMLAVQEFAPIVPQILNSHARAVRVLAKTIPHLDPQIAAIAAGDTARLKRSQERASARETVNKEEPEMVKAVGGESDATYVPVDPSMPIGAHVKLGKKVYTLRADRKLHFDAEMTEKTIFIP